MYCKVSVVNNGGRPGGRGCLGTVCKNAVAEGGVCPKYNHLKLIKYFFCWRVKLQKSVLVKLTGFYFTYIQAHAHTKLLFVKFLRITTKGEREVVFMFCNYCFLSLSCSSFWSIIFVTLDLFWSLNLKKHRRFPASLVFLIHTLLQTFHPVCTMASDTCR